MVDSDDIDLIQGHLHALSPPGKVVLSVDIPVIDGVAPKLSVFGECIGRAACLCCLHSVFINLEKLVMSPGIDAVTCHIDGNVSDNADTKRVGIFMKVVPLAVEEELENLVDFNFLGKLLGPLAEGCLLSELKIVFPQIPA